MALLTRDIIEQIDSSAVLTVEILNNNQYEAKKLQEDLYDAIIYSGEDMFVYDEGFGVVTVCSCNTIVLSNTTYVYSDEVGDNIPTGLFEGTEFSEIILDNVDTSKVTDMTNMFFKCKAHNLNLHSFDVSNVENMSNMFCEIDCEELNLSSFNTSKVKNLSGMFQDSKINKLNLTNFDTSSVKDMSGMFMYFEGFSLDLSSFDTTNVIDMSYMFQCCKALFVNLLSLRTDNVKNMINMFSLFCGEIDAVDKTILEKYEAEGRIENNKLQLEFCLLTRRIIEMIDKPKKLVFKSNVSIENKINKATLLAIDIKRISKYLYLYETDDSICLMSSKLIKLDGTRYDKYYKVGLFENTKFQSIDFDNIDTSGVTDMSYMFSGCDAESINLSSFDTSNVTDMTDMFFQCDAKIECKDSRIMEEYENRKHDVISEEELIKLIEG